MSIQRWLHNENWDDYCTIIDFEKKQKHAGLVFQQLLFTLFECECVVDKQHQINHR